MKHALKTTNYKKYVSSFAVLGLIAGLAQFVAPGASAAPVAPAGAGFTVSESDLAYILDQIKIAEAHSTTGVAPSSNYSLRPDGSVPGVTVGTNPLVVGSTLTTDIPDPLLPLGLRQIDGRNNNLSDGYSEWSGYNYLVADTAVTGKSVLGSAGQPFKRETPLSWRDGYSNRVGSVTDNVIRTISNLIADQSPSNPAALAASNGAFEGVSNSGTYSYVIPNKSVNAGINAPNSGIFSLFGQFFDHGLDLGAKSSSQKIRVCLNSDDPLVVAGKAATNSCMSTGRSILNSDGSGNINSTTPWIDQNQSYSSHPSKQVFLREYAMVNGRPLSTGKLFGSVDGSGNIANWKETKDLARTMLGIELVDTDIFQVPVVLTNEYGQFLRGPNGFPQLVYTNGSVVEGNPSAPISTTGAMPSGQAFLDDINPFASPNHPGYDQALLEAHFITGDGRGNENIGLTAIHAIFHSEHDRLVDQIMATINASTNATLRSIADGFGNGSTWNGERLFQAAKFVNEMEYQHIVFGEFVRSVQPLIRPFAAYDPTLDPTITEEFANAAYRYGHSQLNADIKRVDAQGADKTVSLFDGFLNPLAFNSNFATAEVNRLDASTSAGLVMRGMSSQVGNSIDEFVTGTLRNTLLGAPLDLATLNIARARDNGLARLNQARDTYGLSPYTSWFQFGYNLQNQASLANFIAAYGTLAEIQAEPSIAGKRALGEWVVNCAIDGICDTADVVAAIPTIDATPLIAAYAEDFLFAHGSNTSASTGVDDVDLWIGGLAEAHQTQAAPAGASLLGSTLDHIFKTQMENLQEGDRFYYLGRTAGMSLAGELETNFLSELVMRNTDVRGLPAMAFNVPSQNLNLFSSTCVEQKTTVTLPERLSCVGSPTSSWIYSGTKHLVWDGSEGDDTIFSGGGNDTLRGNGGNDRLTSGFGDDFIYGGTGNDFMFDTGGIDIFIGGDGNDYMEGGTGADTFNGGAGLDFFVSGRDSTVTLGGEGDDFLLGGTSADALSGDDGNDWLDGGTSSDSLIGDVAALFVGFFASTPGDNVLIGGSNNDISLGGDGLDINVSGTGTDSYTGGFGFDWETAYTPGVSTKATFDLGLIAPPAGNVVLGLADTFLDVEGGSGGDGNDVILGDPRTALNSVTPPFTDELLASESLKIQNLRALVNVGGNGNRNAWLNGNILLGGNGGDTITGLGGDDRIDGDAYLEVGLSIPKSVAIDAVLAPLGTPLKGIYLDASTTPGTDRWITQNIALLKPLVASGALTTPDIIQVKRIMPGDSAKRGPDTAVFSNPQANYTIVYNNDGSITVTDGGNGLVNDGTDTLTGIEVLRFAGGTTLTVGLPRTVAATGLDGGANVTWLAPTSAAGWPVTNYTVNLYTAQTAGTLIGTCSTPGTPLTCVVAPIVPFAITNGTTYYLDVTATSAFGSVTSNRVSVVPNPAPNAPINLTATNVAATSATLSWAASVVPSGGSAVTGYTVTLTPGATCNVVGTATTCNATGLSASTNYSAVVQARNAQGRSVASIPVTFTTLPSGVPSVPRTFTATIGAGNVATLAWVASATNAVGLTYTVTASPSTGITNSCTSVSALTCTMSGLLNGTTYTFSVIAHNIVGNSPAALTSVTPVKPVSGVPGAVTGLSATLRGVSATVKWSAPAVTASNGATSYTITTSGATSRAPQIVTSNALTLQAAFNIAAVGSTTITIVPRNAAGAGPAVSITVP